MVSKKDFVKLSDYLWEIPKSYRDDMRVPARIHADEKLLEAALDDRSIEQLVNTTTLPGIVKYALAMPDIHQGYGFSIGGVAATRYPEGVVSPGGVGYDINCGVRLLASRLNADDAKPYMSDLITALYNRVPSGVGEGGPIRLSATDMSEVLVKGAGWAVKAGYGIPQDLDHLEERGAMPGADPSKVSERAKSRGKNQLGTLGSGNHFLEVDEIAEIFDPTVADVLGLFPGQLMVQIHSGSRGFGHQVCTDYVRSLQGTLRKFGIQLPDRELVCAPMSSPEGQAYFAAMAGAANYAWANRQCLTHHARRAFEEVLTPHFKECHLRTIYDVAHNIAKIEEYEIDGHRMKLTVHRKGATRAFGPGHPSLPPDYRSIGQPVLVPGDMGTASYILIGTEKSVETFGSAAHGAGRVWSRSQAKREVRGEKLKRELEARGIKVRAGSMAGLAEEAPDAYKDVERVVAVMDKAGIACKVARLKPLAVMKG